jgi:hypothetical protein
MLCGQVGVVRKYSSGPGPGRLGEQRRVATVKETWNWGGRMRKRERGLNAKSTGRAPDGGDAQGGLTGYGPGTVLPGVTGFDRTGRTRRARRGAGERMGAGAAWEFPS